MIIRRQITANFTIIPNDAIMDTRLSIGARWLLCYLLSRPQDWVVRVGDIQKQAAVGRDKAYSLIKELIGAGWVRKDEGRQEGGKWAGVEYVVMDQPEGVKSDTLPFPENPYPAEPYPANTEHTKNGKTPKTEQDQNISADAEFDEFWAAYPKRPRNPKAPARKKYLHARRVLNVKHETLVNAVKAYAASVAGNDPQFTKLAETWLNKRCWEDEYEPVAAATVEWDIDPLVAVYPGTVNDRRDAARLAAATSATPQTLEEAAKKYGLLLKQQSESGLTIVAPPLETWLRFRWREMDAYEFCRIGMRNKLAVKLRKDRAA